MFLEFVIVMPKKAKAAMKTIYNKIRPMSKHFAKKMKKKSRFVAADQWPPYSPDLNPLDFNSGIN